MADFLLGIDIGTSACKIAVFDRYGNVMTEKSAPYKIYYPKSGYVEQKPLEWWSVVCVTIKNVMDSGIVNAADIKAVGIDGQSWSAIMIDKNGDVLFDNPIWMDTRSSEICEELKKAIGEKAIFEVCGNPLSPTYTTPKILWFKRNYSGVFKNVYKVLQSNSYIIYKLTGQLSQDITQGYGLHFYDIKKSGWNIDLAKSMDIDLDLFPEIMDCHHIAGKISAESAALTGLKAGTPVVAGGLDAACGTLGAGVIDDGQTQEQGGQSGGMSICLESYKTHEKLIMSNHIVPGRWLLQGGTIGGGGSFKWLNENLLCDLNFTEMDSLASSVEPGSGGLVFLPYMAGERSPIWDEKAKGMFYGLDYSKNRGHFIRAVMEGVAYSLLHNIKTAEEVESHINTMYSIGGSSNSGVWMQIKSDVTGKSISVPSAQGATTTLGAAMTAGVGIGMYTDFHCAVKDAVKIKKTYMPDYKNYETYQKGYGIYLELYEKLKNTMRK